MSLIADLIEQFERLGKLPDDIPTILRLAFHADYEAFKCEAPGCDVEEAERRDRRRLMFCSHPDGRHFFCNAHVMEHLGSCEWERRNREIHFQPERG